ncbi:unnamed protein product [Gulo gulo]|uniref:Uncharacterized protein n=1 Tax=Gulo gulo TaxID=48420 RepID=A0A9X9ME25_GULGU|nr:unnamed protein product [Gulo gulo]
MLTKPKSYQLSSPGEGQIQWGPPGAKWGSGIGSQRRTICGDDRRLHMCTEGAYPVPGPRQELQKWKANGRTGTQTNLQMKMRKEKEPIKIPLKRMNEIPKH